MALNRKKDVSDKAKGANVWLDQPQKGLSLIASLLAQPESEAAKAPGLDELTSACSRLASAELDADFAKIRQMVELFQLPSRSKMLSKSAIAGFGGGFSSGKSSVLNSLLGENAQFLLPVDRRPTTSISTYIMQGPVERAIACAITGREVELDPAALDAISHKFQTRHGISLAQYIEFVGITLPQFPCAGVSLLDTPGYDKADTATAQQHHDRLRSQTALSSVDHLVWVIDASAPMLSQSDADFIRDLKLTGEITVILNKCDLHGDIFNCANPDGNSRVASVKENMEKQKIPYSAVIPYSAAEPEWNNGRSKIISFLGRVASGKKSGQERIAQMDHICQRINKQFAGMLDTYHKDELAKIDECIDASNNPLELRAIAEMRGLLGFERAILEHDYRVYSAGVGNLQKLIARQMEVPSA